MDREHRGDLDLEVKIQDLEMECEIYKKNNTIVNHLLVLVRTVAFDEMSRHSLENHLPNHMFICCAFAHAGPNEKS